MHDRTANLLGAAALAVTDLVLDAATGAAEASTSGAAALVVLSAAPGLGVTELGRRVGLTQSAAARMVDALQASGLVERRPGGGRTVHVHLTAAGREAVRRTLIARSAPLADLLDVLDDTERATLTELLSKLLTRLYTRIGDPDVLCRLCDRECCTTGAPCPVGRAARSSPPVAHLKPGTTDGAERRA